MDEYKKALMFSLLREYKAEKGERFKRKLWFLGSLLVMLVLALIVLKVSGG